MSINLKLENGETVTVRTSQLAKFDYFQDILQEEEIEIPRNQYSEEIIDLITENVDLNSLDLTKALRYVAASAFLGRVDPRFIRKIEEIVTTRKSLRAIIPNLDLIRQMRLMPLFANLVANVVYRALQVREVDLVRTMVPYMSIFKEAYTICRDYHFDFDLITSNPTIRDMYLIPGSEEICQIFRYNKQVLDTFNSYFETTSFFIRVSDGIPTREHKDSDFVLRVSTKGKRYYEFPGNLSPVNLPNPMDGWEAFNANYQTY